MASNTTRVIALGALTGLGLVAALGAGNGGSVTPGPQSITVAAPLKKVGTVVGLNDPGQNKGWVGHDGGWSAVNVVTRVTPTYPLENAGTLAAPVIALNESDCTGNGFGWVYDLGAWSCVRVLAGRSVQSIAVNSWGRTPSVSAIDGGSQVYSAVAWSSTLSLFASVGGNSAIATSPDGITWTRRNPPTTAEPYADVVWGGTAFYAYGPNYGAVSTDGSTWTQTASPAFYEYRAIAYGADHIVAIGTDNHGYSVCKYSTDIGTTWTTCFLNAGEADAGLYASQRAESVAFGNGRFVVVGGNYSAGTSGFISTSTDGETWAAATVPTVNRLMAVAWNGNVWAAVGPGSQGVYSTNGTSWTVTNLPSMSAERLVSMGTLFVSANTTSVMTSFDGQAWSVRTLPAAIGTSMAYDPVSGTAVSANGNNYVSTPL